MGTMKKPNILIVDDDESNLYLLHSFLKILEVNFILAQSGPEALSKIRDENIAMALLDIQMTGMNGVELATQIQSDSSREIVPIIFITGQSKDEKELEECYESGAVDFILKPVRKNILLSKVRIFLELYRQKQIILEHHFALEKSAFDLAKINITLTESESNFRTFFQTIDDLIVVANQKGQILFTNIALHLKLAFTTEDLAKMNLIDIHPFERRREAEEIFAGMVRGDIGSSSLPVVNNKGAHIPAYTRVWLGKWNDEDCFFCLIKDLSKELEAEESFEHLFRNNPALMALQEMEEQKFIDVNDAFLKVLGYTSVEILGRTPLEIGLIPFPEQQMAMAVKLRTDGILTDTELQVRHKEGKILDGIFSGEVIVNRGKKYFLTVMIDITKRKLIEKELQDSLESLKKSQEISHVGSWQMNLGTGKVSWSDEMYKIFGYERNRQDENMLDVFASAIFPEDKKNVENRMEATLKDGICRSMDYRIVRKDGKIRWVFAKGEPLLNKEGLVIAQHGILQDLTEQKQHEFALKESERMYRTILNASPESILIMDMKGIITEISDITHEIFGTENKSEFVGINFFNFVPPEELKRFKEILHNTQIEGLVQNVEMFLITKNHSRFICELSTTLIQEANGDPKAYMAIVRDISLRKKIEQQLIRSGRMVSLGEMASAMAHEINQPLLSISLGIDNLFHKIEKINVLNESYFRDKSEKIFQDVARIGRIIDHVRIFSRDNEEFVSTSFDLNDSISNAISMISEQFKNQHIHIIQKLDKKISSVVGNTYRFEQVILNLLTNAKDALDEKTKRSKLNFEKTIHVRTFQKEQMIVVELTDDGCGIEPEILDRIMLPFFSTKETGKGTGIGLSISFGIIKEMNGTFDVESHPMVGSTFRIKFPVPNIEK